MNFGVHRYLVHCSLPSSAEHTELNVSVRPAGHGFHLSRPKWGIMEPMLLSPPLVSLFSTCTPCFSQTICLLLATLWCLLTFCSQPASFSAQALFLWVYSNSMSPAVMDLQDTAEFWSLTPTSFSDPRAISVFSNPRLFASPWLD